MTKIPRLLQTIALAGLFLAGPALAEEDDWSFNLTPYLFPLLFLVVGSVFLLGVFRHWRRRKSVEPAPATQAADRRRRSVSYTRSAIARRSPEPA